MNEKNNIMAELTSQNLLIHILKNSNYHQGIQTSSEVLDHLNTPTGSGYFVNVNPFIIEGYTVYELVKPNELPSELFNGLVTILQPMLDKGFSGERADPKEFAEYLFNDGGMVSYLVADDSKRIISMVGRRVDSIVQKGNNDIIAMNMNSAITDSSDENRGIYTKTNDGILQRLSPDYVCTSTMNPRVVKSVRDTLERNNYHVLSPTPDNPLTEEQIAFFQALKEVGSLANPIPNDYGIRERQFPGLRSDEDLDFLWQQANQFSQTQSSRELLKAGIFQPKSGDQLFVIGFKLESIRR